MRIRLKRVYLPPTRNDGIRILVERLWPRGLTKAAAKIDLWLKDAAPSSELRQWFHHDPDLWSEFKTRYFAELRTRPAALTPLLKLEYATTVTFLFAAREEQFNNAVALKEYLEITVGTGADQESG